MRNDVYLVTLIDMRVTLGGGEATLACEKIKAGGTGFSENLTFRCATLSKLSNKIYIFGGQPPIALTMTIVILIMEYTRWYCLP